MADFRESYYRAKRTSLLWSVSVAITSAPFLKIEPNGTALGFLKISGSLPAYPLQCVLWLCALYYAAVYWLCWTSERNSSYAAMLGPYKEAGDAIRSLRSRVDDVHRNLENWAEQTTRELPPAMVADLRQAVSQRLTEDVPSFDHAIATRAAAQAVHSIANRIPYRPEPLTNQLGVGPTGVQHHASARLLEALHFLETEYTSVVKQSLETAMTARRAGLAAVDDRLASLAATQDRLSTAAERLLKPIQSDLDELANPLKTARDAIHQKFRFADPGAVYSLFVVASALLIADWLAY